MRLWPRVGHETRQTIVPHPQPTIILTMCVCQYIAEREVRVLRLRGHGDGARPSYLTSGSSAAPHTASAKAHLPAISKGDEPLENAGA